MPGFEPCEMRYHRRRRRDKGRVNSRLTTQASRMSMGRMNQEIILYGLILKMSIFPGVSKGEGWPKPM